MSTFSIQGLVVQVYEPTITLTTGTPNVVVIAPRGVHVATLSEQVEQYSHVIAALGGFFSCDFSFTDTPAHAEEWIERGLGRHVEVLNAEGGIVWEGFVDEVEAGFGSLNVTRGPLSDIGNRARLEYSTVDTSTSPPTMGIRASTDWAENTASERQYGIWPRVLSSGGVTESLTDQLRDAYLAEHALPETTQRVSLGSESNLTPISLSCKGYVARLNYAYEQTALTGEGDLSAKLASILADEPNGLLGATSIAANTLQVPVWEDEDRLAWDVIKSLTAKGDASLQRYLFGMYEERRAVYAAAPTTVEYFQTISDPRQMIMTPDYAVVRPWDVRPGKWLLFTDLLVGRMPEETQRANPRTMFIEGVTFTAPYSLTLEGGKVATIAQRLAQLGLSGIGA